MKTNYHYDLNPPEPVILEPQNPIEFFEEMIAEHNTEKCYERQHIIDFDYMEMSYIKELIKNEPIKTV